MGSSESTLFSCGDKTLIVDQENKMFWITKIKGKELIRIPVTVTTVSSIGALSPNIPLIVHNGDNDSVEHLISYPKSYEDPKGDYIKICHIESWWLFTLRYIDSGIEIFREFQVYYPKKIPDHISRISHRALSSFL